MGLTRGIDPVLLAVLEGHFHPVVLMESVLPSETIRAHSGRGTITWDGHDWIGLDRLARFTGPGEGMGLARQASTLEIVMDLRSTMESSGAANRNADVTVWWGATTTAGGTVLIGEPFQLDAGYVDDWRRSFARSGAGAQHGVTVSMMPGPGARDGLPLVHSPEAQQARFPGDTGARHFVNAIKRATNPPLFPEP
jgi:hypothetical protein